MVDYKHPVNPGLIGSRWHDPKRKHLHLGLDYKEGTGNFVRAVADGTVRVVAQHRLWGFYVQIEHADGRVSSYHQLQRKDRPAVGQHVRQGTIVGRVGNPLIGWSQADKEKTGIWSGQVERDSSGTLVSTGPHLHLGILEAYGKPWVNPESVITTKATAAEPAGGGATPLTPIEPEAPKRRIGKSMIDWDFYRTPAGDIVVDKGFELHRIGSRADYDKIRDIIRIHAHREPQRGWVVPPAFDRPTEFYNLDASGWAVLQALVPNRD